MQQSSPYVIINQGIAKLLSGYPIYTWGGIFEGPRLLESWITSKLFKLWPPNEATFPKNYLGKFESRDYVYVNIDVTMATEFWQPCF